MKESAYVVVVTLQTPTRFRKGQANQMRVAAGYFTSKQLQQSISPSSPLTSLLPHQEMA